MDRPKSLFSVLAEWWEQRKSFQQTHGAQHAGFSRWLPTPGNAIFTVLVLAGLLWAQSAGALPLAAPNPGSTGVIAYQGRLANTSGQPLTGVYSMVFRLYSVASGSAPLWEEQWTGSNSVQVSDGLFNVMLGSLTPIPSTVTTANSSLFLGISVGSDGEMSPRVQLGSVPYAIQALTVPDGSVTTTKIADASVTRAKLASSAVPTLLGSKTCSGCGDSQQNSAARGWNPVLGANNEVIEVTVTTTGRPLLVTMTARYQTSAPTNRWCYVAVMQGGNVVRGVHLDGSAQPQTDWGCSGSYLFSDLPAGSYTFRARGWIGEQVNINWYFERQIAVFEY